MNKIYFIFPVLIIIFSCNHEELMIIKTTSIDHLVDESLRFHEIKIQKHTAELVFIPGRFVEILKIEGLERLTNLTKLDIRLGGFYSNYTFLENFNQLEVLIMWACNIKDFEFLKKMPRLKIFDINGSKIFSKNIDFINNKELLLFSMSNIAYAARQSIPSLPFSPRIDNLPKSLEYIIMSENPNVILSKTLLDHFIKIPSVILGVVNFNEYEKRINTGLKMNEVEKSYVENRGFFLQHPNFIFKSPKNVLAAELLETVSDSNNQRFKLDIWEKKQEVNQP